ATTKPVAGNTALPVTDKRRYTWMYVVVFLLAFLVYSNTVRHQYALDDAMMITQNEVTLKGFDGIAEQWQHSFLYGFMHREGYDAGSSHWRPLVMTSFSIDTGLWGTEKPGNSHLVNVLLFALISVLLFHWLRKYLLQQNWPALIAAALFAVHPIHTEVVANIKGRDELLSLFFILISVWLLWKSIRTGKHWIYIGSLLSYFTSLLAKENGITMLAGIPVLLYFFTDLPVRRLLLLSSGYLLMLASFLLIRNAVVPLELVKMDAEIMNNPYLLAKGSEVLPTKIYVLLLLLKNLFWPYPLSYDYSYNQIPYTNWSNPAVWLSILLYAALGALAVFGIRSKSRLSGAIILFFITFSISTNLVVETGVMMAERMLFMPSIFAMLALVLGWQHLQQKNLFPALFQNRVSIAVIVCLLLLLGSGWSYVRNADWKNDTTLNLADVTVARQSARVTGGAGTACLTLADQPGILPMQKKEYLEQAIAYYKQSAGINPLYNDAWINMGVAYSRMDSLASAEASWNEVRRRQPEWPKLREMDLYLSHTLFNRGYASEQRQQIDSAIGYYERAQPYFALTDTLRINNLYNLAGCYYKKQDYRQAREWLMKVDSLKPNYNQVRQGIAACDHFLQTAPEKASPAK
ncbi:MAG TPA: hypothetical protein PKK69_01200, partial [Ferruginibacter sp.]|nr:hypothetical protein [Ferruginibacter sp.]